MKFKSQKIPFGILIGLSILLGLIFFLSGGTDTYLWIGITIGWALAIVSFVLYLFEKSYFYIKKDQYLSAAAVALVIGGLCLILIYFLDNLLFEKLGMKVLGSPPNLKESKIAQLGALLFLAGISVSLISSEIEIRKKSLTAESKKFLLRVIIFAFLGLLAFIQLQLIFKLLS